MRGHLRRRLRLRPAGLRRPYHYLRSIRRGARAVALIVVGVGVGGRRRRRGTVAGARARRRVFGELQRARSDGSLAPRATASVAAAENTQKKARREHKKRPMEMSTMVRPPRFWEVIHAPKKDKQLKSHPQKNIESEILHAHIKERQAAKSGKQPYYQKKLEIRQRKFMNKYNELKIHRRLARLMPSLRSGEVRMHRKITATCLTRDLVMVQNSVFLLILGRLLQQSFFPVRNRRPFLFCCLKIRQLWRVKVVHNLKLTFGC